MVTYDKKELECLRLSMKEKLIKEFGQCERCGFNEFQSILELAHIKHGKETEKMVRANLLLLCPNCHKAFDRGLTSVDGIWSDSKWQYIVYWQKKRKLENSKKFCVENYADE